MASIVPIELKPFNKYLIQARKLEKVHPVAAYYCRYTFLKKGLALTKKKPDATDAKKFLERLMDKMMESKKALPESKEEKHEMMMDMALNVFAMADDIDRKGNATKKTAIMFRTSILVMEASEALAELPEDMKEKLRYARWKVVDILKAIKEGRKPTPGPAGGCDTDEEMDKNGEMEQETPTPAPQPEPEPIVQEPVVPIYAAEPTTVPVVVASAPPVETGLADIMRGLGQPMEAKAQARVVAVPPKVTPAAPGDIVISARPMKDRVGAETQAERFIGHAQSALRFHDVDTAIEKLKTALSMLIPYQGQEFE
ncbi:hypothetical protein AAMO2058_001674600 [Amorphochlora amoebiformis]